MGRRPALFAAFLVGATSQAPASVASADELLLELSDEVGPAARVAHEAPEDLDSGADLAVGLRGRLGGEDGFGIGMKLGMLFDLRGQGTPQYLVGYLDLPLSVRLVDSDLMITMGVGPSIAWAEASIGVDCDDVCGDEAMALSEAVDEHDTFLVGGVVLLGFDYIVDDHFFLGVLTEARLMAATRSSAARAHWSESLLLRVGVRFGL